jgi:cytochrome P450
MDIISWTDPRFSQDPYEVLRGADAVATDPLLEGVYVAPHAVVSELLRSHAYAKHPTKALDGPYTQMMLATSSNSLLFMDDPDHTRVRSLVNRAFTRSRVESIRPEIEQIASSLLDAVADESSFDLMTTFADPLPVLVIGEVLGIDPADRAQFKRWSDDLVLAFDPFLPADTVQRVVQSGADLRSYFTAHVEDRRRAPRDDLTSALVHSHDADERLSMEELLSLLSLLLIAGNVTTTDLIGNAVLALLEHPDQLAILRGDRSLTTNAVEEALRYDSPVLLTDRIPVDDTQVAGCPMKRGQWLWPVLAAANRDPSVHPEPDRFDITRERIDHLSFGGGPHYCLGAPLARLEAQIALSALLDRYSSITLDPNRSPRRKIVPGFRGLAELPLVVERTSRATHP